MSAEARLLDVNEAELLTLKLEHSPKPNPNPNSDFVCRRW